MYDSTCQNVETLRERVYPTMVPNVCQYVRNDVRCSETVAWECDTPNGTLGACATHGLLVVASARRPVGVDGTVRP